MVSQLTSLPNEILTHITQFVGTGDYPTSRLSNLRNLALTNQHMASVVRSSGLVTPIRNQLRRDYLERRRQEAADARAEWRDENNDW